LPSSSERSCAPLNEWPKKGANRHKSTAPAIRGKRPITVTIQPTMLPVWKPMDHTNHNAGDATVAAGEKTKDTVHLTNPPSQLSSDNHIIQHICEREVVFLGTNCCLA
jgi:hypothetical protein